MSKPTSITCSSGFGRAFTDCVVAQRYNWRFCERLESVVEKLKGALVVGFLRLFALLPWRAVQAVGNAIGWLMWKLPNGSRDVVRINLSKCFPELNPVSYTHLDVYKRQGCARPVCKLRMNRRFTHSRVLRVSVHRLLQKLAGRLSTRLPGSLISLMNGTKALILLGHLPSVVWITRSQAATMAAVFCIVA